MPVQFVVAALTSVLLLFTLRPWLLRHLRARMPLVETNAAALGRPRGGGRLDRHR